MACFRHVFYGTIDVTVSSVAGEQQCFAHRPSPRLFTTYIPCHFRHIPMRSLLRGSCSTQPAGTHTYLVLSTVWHHASFAKEGSDALRAGYTAHM
jgi:hypothetical protein